MSTSSLLSPLAPSTLPPSKRPSMGGREEAGTRGLRGREDGRVDSPKKEKGKEAGRVGEIDMPEWGHKLFEGRRDPGGEFRFIQNISSERVAKENKETCYLSAEQNKKKNRYKDVLPYEHSRVRLEEGGLPNDYINANLIHGVLGYRYIATQAPLPITIGDFCQMVWEKDISLILMLTRIIEKKTTKAYQYWPCQVGRVDNCYNYSLKLLSEKVHDCGYVCVRRLQIFRRGTGGEESRELVHLHYTEWPDYGIPSSNAAIRTLLHITDIHYKQEQKRRKGPVPPILVHCSAGIGRAGTFIALHQAIKQIEAKFDQKYYLQNGEKGKEEKAEGSADSVLSIKDIVLSMREQRRGMVQTKDQYCVIYRVAEDALFGFLGSISWDEERKAVGLFLDSCREVEPQPKLPQITSMEDYHCQVGMKFSSAVQHNNDRILPFIEEDDDEEEIEYEEIDISDEED